MPSAVSMISLVPSSREFRISVVIAVSPGLVVLAHVLDEALEQFFEDLLVHVRQAFDKHPWLTFLV